MKSLKVIELFAGVGGFRVGLERADADFFKVVWANQWEPATKAQHAAWVYERRSGHAVWPIHLCDDPKTGAEGGTRWLVFVILPSKENYGSVV